MIAFDHDVGLLPPARPSLPVFAKQPFEARLCGIVQRRLRDLRIAVVRAEALESLSPTPVAQKRSDRPPTRTPPPKRRRPAVGVRTEDDGARPSERGEAKRGDVAVFPQQPARKIELPADPRALRWGVHEPSPIRARSKRGVRTLAGVDAGEHDGGCERRVVEERRAAGAETTIGEREQ